MQNHDCLNWSSCVVFSWKRTSNNFHTSTELFWWLDRTLCCKCVAVHPTFRRIFTIALLRISIDFHSIHWKQWQTPSISQCSWENLSSTPRSRLAFGPNKGFYLRTELKKMWAFPRVELHGTIIVFFFAAVFFFWCLINLKGVTKKKWYDGIYYRIYKYQMWYMSVSENGEWPLQGMVISTGMP